MVLMGGVGLGYFIVPELLLGVFSDDPEKIAAGVAILRLMELYQVFVALALAYLLRFRSGRWKMVYKGTGNESGVAQETPV